ncbi:MAG: hypothetical protein H6512_14150 [Acidimicrobiia bacterium]|nr:hypothetical protein [Acidimicrobiia bacterium]
MESAANGEHENLGYVDGGIEYGNTVMDINATTGQQTELFEYVPDDSWVSSAIRSEDFVVVAWASQSQNPALQVYDGDSGSILIDDLVSLDQSDQGNQALLRIDSTADELIMFRSPDADEAGGTLNRYPLTHDQNIANFDDGTSRKIGLPEGGLPRFDLRVVDGDAWLSISERRRFGPAPQSR